MTPKELIANYKKNNPDGHFFDKKTLRFFGERLSDMTVEAVKVVTSSGKLNRAYKLTTLQRYAPNEPLYKKFYFDAESFKEISNIICEV